MAWTRRDLLANVGLGAAGALLWACGGAARGGLVPVAPAPPSSDEIRAWLADAVARLTGAGADALGRARLVETVVASSDPVQRAITRHRMGDVELVVRRGSAVRVARAEALSADAVAALARALGGTGGAVRPSAALAEDLGDDLGPGLPDDAAWLRQVDGLAARADGVASSRIVHRTAITGAVDERRWIVGGGRDVALRRRQAVAEVTLIGWTGTQPQHGVARRGARALLADDVLGERELAIAAARAIELMSPAGFVGGDAAIALSPEVVAALAGALATARDRVALAGAATAWGPAVALWSEPDGDGVGAELLDEDGAALAPRAVLQTGQPAAPGPCARGHLAWRAGAQPLPELLTALGDGYLLDGARAVHVGTSAVTIYAERARRYRGGAPTGHVFADVAASAPLPALLAAMAAASREVLDVVVPDHGQLRSVRAPWLTSRARLWQVRA
jgi:hypothetical protein